MKDNVRGIIYGILKEIQGLVTPASSNLSHSLSESNLCLIKVTKTTFPPQLVALAKQSFHEHLPKTF